jgi:membrane associated rhomboid family serine protease
MMMFGFMAEKYIGVKKLCFILFASGFLGNLLSAVIYPYYVTTGSSGMAFGLLMLHFSFLYKNYSKLGFAKYFSYINH